MFNRIRSALAMLTKNNQMSPVNSRGGWFSLWGAIGEAFSGDWQKNITHHRQSVLHYSPVFACITLMASDIAKLDWCMKSKNKASGIWEDAPSSRAAPYMNVLRHPNKYQNHIQFKECWMLSKLTYGNTYVLLQRNLTGMVTSMYILDPTHVTPMVTPDGDVWYQVSADNMTGGILENGVMVPASEIIHDRFNCLFHPLVGLSPIFACALPALQGIKVNENYYTFFKNGARPSGILTAPGSIPADKAATLKAKFDEGFTAENAGKTAVLGDGLKYERVTMSAVDSQVVEQMKFGTEQICACFHMPLYKIGAGTAPAYGNVSASTQDYYSSCLQKPIEDMEACLDDGMGLKDDIWVHLDIDNLLRMDQATLMTTLGEGVKASILAPNEGRKRINLPPVAGGDEPLAQQQNYSLGALAKRDALPDPFISAKPTSVPEGDPAADPGLLPPDGDPPPPKKNAAFYRKALESFDLEMAA